MGIALTLLVLAVFGMAAILAFLYLLIWLSFTLEQRMARLKATVRSRHQPQERE